MSDIMELLETLNPKDWQELFAHIEKEERRIVSSRNDEILYRYLGEIDCPEDMLYDFATIKDIEKCGGKTNWFICSDGSFFTCGDCATDSLLMSAKVVYCKFPFEIKRDEIYHALSKEERIAFRVKLQGITTAEAKEIVCDELGIPAYENTYKFSVKEILLDTSNNSEEMKTYTMPVLADTEEEARERLVSMSHKVGAVVCTGTKFTKEDNRKMQESGRIFGYRGGTPYTIILKSRDLILVGVEKNAY